MTKEQCQTCMEWFEDSELDAHLNDHIGFKGQAEQLTTQRRGRRGALLGAISSIYGFFTFAWLFGVTALGEATCSELSCGVPLSRSLLILSWFCGSVLGLAGAWNARKYRIAGGIALLVGGLLPLVATFSDLLPFWPFDYISLLYFILFLQWWTAALVFAGARVLLDFPRPASRS